MIRKISSPTSLCNGRQRSGALVLTGFSHSMASLISLHGAICSLVSLILQKYLALIPYERRLERKEAVSDMNIDYEEPEEKGWHNWDGMYYCDIYAIQNIWQQMCNGIWVTEMTAVGQCILSGDSNFEIGPNKEARNYYETKLGVRF